MCTLYFVLHSKSNFRNSSFEFGQIKLGKVTDELAINWQNFAQVCFNNTTKHAEQLVIKLL